MQSVGEGRPLIDDPDNVLVEQDDVDYLAVDTDFGQLRYPDQWVEFAKATQSQKDGNEVISYDAIVDGKTYHLFNIIIGDSNLPVVGTTVGKDGTERNVYVEAEELAGIDDLPENVQERLHAMQEDVNYIIDNLNK